ncbi:cytochrome c oxidase subunit 6C-1-like [Dermacentor variabilis]|uniref:cytochrome c oxidase subunit 6C-1-like n=1 Tax=Dermacentor variabilis TaxID=34621 RepID=UPI003F5C078B
MSQLARPQFHGLLKSHLRKHIAICLTLSAIGGVAWRYLVVNKRRQRYADFYKNYDAEAECEKMMEIGVLPRYGN